MQNKHCAHLEDRSWPTIFYHVGKGINSKNGSSVWDSPNVINVHLEDRSQPGMFHNVGEGINSKDCCSVWDSPNVKYHVTNGSTTEMRSLASWIVSFLEVHTEEGGLTLSHLCCWEGE